MSNWREIQSEEIHANIKQKCFQVGLVGGENLKRKFLSDNIRKVNVAGKIACIYCNRLLSHKKSSKTFHQNLNITFYHATKIIITKLLSYIWCTCRHAQRRNLPCEKTSTNTTCYILLRQIGAYRSNDCFIFGRKFTTIYFCSKAFTMCSRIFQIFRSSAVKGHCFLQINVGLAALLFEDLIRDLQCTFFRKMLTSAS